VAYKIMGLPVAKASMEVNDKLLLILVKKASLQVRPEVISPAKTAALATPAESGELGYSTPATLAMCENKIDQLLVFLSCPRALLHTEFVATRLSAHHYSKSLVAISLPPNYSQRTKPHSPTFIY
jgi:hypothetical protein